jgi:hypothetical protein
MSDAMGPAPFAPTAPGAPGAPSPQGGVGGAFGAGLLRVVPGSVLSEMEARERAEKERARAEARMEPAMDDLAAYVMRLFDTMRRHRDSADGWTHRLVHAMRCFNGEYDPATLAEIKRFGGSEVYARIIAVKCRAAASMLRDIYLSGGPRPWGVEPTPDPVIPDDVEADIEKALAAEQGTATLAAQQGMTDPETGQPLKPPTEEEVLARREALKREARLAALKKAREHAEQAEKLLDDMLVEGGFYQALAEFLMDLPLFPFAVIQGPVVYLTPSVKWERGPDGQVRAVKKNVARMFWKRVSPFDIWWSPGASTVEAADFIVRERKSRAEINAMLGVPGYKEENVRAILDEFPGGFTLPPDSSDSTRAALESRESTDSDSGMYDCLMFHGSVQGRMLREYGMSRKDVPDETRDYSVQLWLIHNKVIKCQLSPSPRERPPFYITSYNKVPGTMVGNAITDVLSDIQDVCNATLRALVNNMAMSSGPQVAVNEDVVSLGENTNEMWPWKIWKYTNGRPGSTVNDPIRFFMPNSNAQQLLGVYEKFTQIADETSALPRYVTGSERMGGAGRTASGLAMLMNNSSKMLQTVVANIDNDIFEPLLQMLYDLLMLTDRTGRMRGDERIMVKGVAVAMQRETERQRQIEMLQATANPIDAPIMGMRGRAALLRAVSKTLGLDGEAIIPSDEELAAREQAAQAAAMAQAMAPPGGAPGAPPGGPPGPPQEQAARQAQGAQQGGAETGPRPIQGPRVNLQQQMPRGTA